MPKEIQESANFRIYISKVQKEIHPDSGLTKEAANEINRLVHELAERLIHEAAVFSHSNHRNTVLLKDVKGACDVVLTSAGFHDGARGKGDDALMSYTTSVAGSKDSRESKTVRAGLKFPPSRVDAIIRYHTHMRVADLASVYLAGVLENMAAELVEGASNAQRSLAVRVRITTKAISEAIHNDAGFSKLFYNTYLSGGVVSRPPKVRKAKL